jgi:hypothetical protein
VRAKTAKRLRKRAIELAAGEKHANAIIRTRGSTIRWHPTSIMAVYRALKHRYKTERSLKMAAEEYNESDYFTPEEIEHQDMIERVYKETRGDQDETKLEDEQTD